MPSRKSTSRSKRGKGRKAIPPRFRGITAEVRESSGLEDARFRVATEGEQKMSDIIMDFVDPYLDGDEGSEYLDKAIGIATIAWNAALVPEGERRLMLDSALRELPSADAVPLAIVLDRMIQRKQERFQANKRTIIRHHIAETEDGLHLSVVSTRPPR